MEPLRIAVAGLGRMVSTAYDDTWLYTHLTEWKFIH